MGPSLSHAFAEVRENYNSLNWWRNRIFVPYVVGSTTRLHPRWPGYDEGIVVMDEEWDNLIVLDACRADVFELVADLDEFDEYRRVVSQGSHSSEWTKRNFAGRKFGDTVYVSANPHTSKEASNSFHRIVKMWERDFDDEENTVLAESMVSAAKDAHEEHPDKRLIVHFMQPHGPFVGSDTEIPDGDHDAYWQAYRENLEYVLENAMELADALPGTTVMTADHGHVEVGRVLTAMGLDSHKPGLRYPGLVEVPWAVLKGDARETTEEATAAAESDSVDARLRQLGYKV